MTSPRLGRSGPDSRKNTIAGLVVLATLSVVAPCGAQTTGGTPGAGRDSGVAVRPDTARADSARADSVRPDSAARDSAARLRGDSLRRPRPDSAAAPARPAAPAPEPVDSALGAACAGAAGDRPDLVLVKFQATATETERAAVAKEVGGTLLGMSQHAAPGSWYLEVPGSAVDPTVADRLILLPPVLEVAATRCPS
jgi:hypothetical protein